METYANPTNMFNSSIFLSRINYTCTVLFLAHCLLLFTRDSIRVYAIARICHANSVRPSVCHTRVLYQNG